MASPYRRLKTILNHLNIHAKSRLSPQGIHDVTVDKSKLSAEYECRLVTVSDFEAIQELCANIYDGNDFVPGCFHRWLNDNNVIFCGIEYKPSSKIISTGVMKIIDGGITSWSMGARAHAKHRGKGLYRPFVKWTDDVLFKLYPNVKRARSTTRKSNSLSLHVSKKMNVLPTDNTKSILYGDISFPSNKTDNSNYKPNSITPNKFETRLTGLNPNAFKLEILSNIDEIINILKYKYNKNELYVDWKIYDLISNKRCIDGNKLLLKKEMLSRRMTVYCNNNKDVMCLYYADQRKRLTQTHFYGTNPHNVLLMIAAMYKQWKKEKYSEIVSDPQNGLKLSIFLEEDLVKSDDKLRKLCQGFGSVVVVEKNLS